MSLFTTELRRLFKRRLTRITLVLVTLLLAVMAAFTAATSQAPTAAGRAAAEAEARPMYEQALRDHERMVAECEAAQAAGENTDEMYPPDCGREYTPELAWYINEPYSFDFYSEGPARLMMLGLLLMLSMVLIGASFVGAEWTSGGMMNLLLWQPRRRKVLLTKLAALLAGTLGVTVVLGALSTLAYWLVAEYRGELGPMTAGAWTSYGLSGLRTVGLVLAVAAAAFGLASLGRHTAMALGVLAGVFVLSEAVLQPLLFAIDATFPERFSLAAHLNAWFSREVTLYDFPPCASSGACEPVEFLLTWQHAGLVFAVGAALALVAAFWSMSRRDVA